MINKFLKMYEKRKKVKLDVNDPHEVINEVIYTLFHIYVTSTNRDDKRDVINLLLRLNDKIVIHPDYWNLIENKKELKRLTQEVLDINNKKRVKVQYSRHRGRDDYSYTHEEWESTKKEFDNKCAYCGRKRALTFDHVHPFSRGGSFTKDNILPACTHCNSSKRDKTLEEWYKEHWYYSETRERRIRQFLERQKELMRCET